MTPAALRDGLVMLHGFTGGPESWDPVWAALPAALRPEADVVLRPALLGHRGAAPAARAVTTFDGEVDRIADLVASTFGARRPHLLGYSLGGRVALGLLLRHPERFRGATLVGAHPGLAAETERAARRSADERWVRLLEQEGLDAFVRAWSKLPLFATQGERVDPGSLAAQRRTRLSQDPHELARSLRVLGLGAMPPRWRALATLAVPVRWLVGALDERFRHLGERAVRASPRAVLTSVPNAGHNVLLECPAAFWES